MAAYSGTPLGQKRGIKADHTILLANAPDRYDELVAPLPGGVRRTDEPVRLLTETPGPCIPRPSRG